MQKGFQREMSDRLLSIEVACVIIDTELGSSELELSERELMARRIQYIHRDARGEIPNQTSLKATDFSGSEPRYIAPDARIREDASYLLPDVEAQRRQDANDADVRILLGTADYVVGVNVPEQMSTPHLNYTTED